MRRVSWLPSAAVLAFAGTVSTQTSPSCGQVFDALGDTGGRARAQRAGA